MSYLGAMGALTFAEAVAQPINWQMVLSDNGDAVRALHTLNETGTDVVGQLQAKVAAGQPLTDVERAWFQTYNDANNPGNVPTGKTVFGSNWQVDPQRLIALGVDASGAPWPGAGYVLNSITLRWMPGVITTTSNAPTAEAQALAAQTTVAHETVDNSPTATPGAGSFKGTGYFNPNNGVLDDADGYPLSLGALAAAWKAFLATATRLPEDAVYWAQADRRAAAIYAAATVNPNGTWPQGQPAPSSGPAHTLWTVTAATSATPPAATDPNVVTTFPAIPTTGVATPPTGAPFMHLLDPGTPGSSEPLPQAPAPVVTPSTPAPGFIASVPTSVWIGGAALLGAYLIFRRGR